MRLKLIISCVVCLAAVCWWYIYTKTEQGSIASSPALTETVDLTNDLNQQTNTNNTTELTAGPTKNQNNTEEDWEEDWLEQMHTRRYSEDITVELTSLGLEFESCGNNDLSWRFKDQTLTAKQTTIRTAVETHCAELLAAYPLLEDDRVKQNMRLMFERFPSSTPLGKFFDRQTNPELRIGLKDFLSELTPLALQAENSQILVMVDWISSSLTYRPSLEKLLQSTNRTYIKTIRTFALTSLSCQFQAGLTCSPTGRFMQDKCFSDERFCGMDFTEWYALAVPSGMQGDVTLIKQYFESLVQP